MKEDDLLTAFVGRRADTVQYLYSTEYSVQCFRILILVDTSILEENWPTALVSFTVQSTHILHTCMYIYSATLYTGRIRRSI